VRWAAKPKYHQEFSQAARYRIHEVKRTGVKVVTGKEVTIANVNSFKPDVLVIATGAVPFVPVIQGVEGSNVATSYDILSGKRPTGKKTLVIGGKREGLTVAEFIAENCGEVVIIEASNNPGADLGGRQQIVVDRLKQEPLVSFRLQTTVERIDRDGVVLRNEGKEEKLTGIDSIVLAWARTPVNHLADEIFAQGNIHEVYRIGDAVLPRDATEAIYEGAVTGRKI
jgi:thioredoxin reductase